MANTDASLLHASPHVVAFLGPPSQVVSACNLAGIQCAGSGFLEVQDGAVASLLGDPEHIAQTLLRLGFGCKSLAERPSEAVDGALFGCPEAGIVEAEPCRMADATVGCGGLSPPTGVLAEPDKKEVGLDGASLGVKLNADVLSVGGSACGYSLVDGTFADVALGCQDAGFVLAESCRTVDAAFGCGGSFSPPAGVQAAELGIGGASPGAKQVADFLSMGGSACGCSYVGGSMASVPAAEHRRKADGAILGSPKAGVAEAESCRKVDAAVGCGGFSSPPTGVFAAEPVPAVEPGRKADGGVSFGAKQKASFLSVGGSSHGGCSFVDGVPTGASGSLACDQGARDVAFYTSLVNEVLAESAISVSAAEPRSKADDGALLGCPEAGAVDAEPCREADAAGGQGSDLSPPKGVLAAGPQKELVVERFGALVGCPEAGIADGLVGISTKKGKRRKGAKSAVPMVQTERGCTTEPVSPTGADALIAAYYLEFPEDVKAHEAWLCEQVAGP